MTDDLKKALQDALNAGDVATMRSLLGGVQAGGPATASTSDSGGHGGGSQPPPPDLTPPNG